MTFHHDPAHGDDDIDHLTAEAKATVRVPCTVTAGADLEHGALARRIDLESRS